MPLPLWVVDAFTDTAFAGNPAAVCVLSNWPADAWLQAVAREMNLSETAFLVRQDGGFRLRWFTPRVEVDLCGHATLASAHALWQHEVTPKGEAISFHTWSGQLRATLATDEIELDFPLTPEDESAPPAGLLTALGVLPRYVGKNKFDYVVELESAEAVRQVRPDFASLAQVSARGVIVTSRADEPRFDFISRFFAPAAGIDEDPVTGSAHCCLADFWRKRLGKDEFLAYQASERGGVVRVRVVGDRVRLGGKAVVVTRGELVAEPPR